MTKPCLLLCCVLFLSGCTALTRYPDRVGPARDVMCQGDYQKAKEELQRKRLDVNKKGVENPKCRDRLCYLFEEGTLHHVASEYADSNKDFSTAENMMEANDERAKIAVGKIAQQGGAILVNDKMIDYEGEGYERVLMHTLSAVNYIMLGDKQGARVEIKMGYQSAVRIRELKAGRIAGMQKQNASGPVNYNNLGTLVNGNMAQQQWAANGRARSARITDTYQNALAYYLSSLVYEANNDYNDAYIDCKSAYKLAPDCVPVQRDLVRLSGILGMSDDKQEWERQFGALPPRAENTGDLIVIFQNGTAAQKQEWKFTLPLPIPVQENGHTRIVPMLIPLALPYYNAVPPPVAGLSVSEANQPIGTTSMMVDMDALAIRNLNDEMPIIITRALLRAVPRAIAQYCAGRNANNDAMGAIAPLAIGLTAMYLEQADLRNWLTMPSNIQILRVSLPEGEHQVTLAVNGGIMDSQTVRVTINKGRFTFVNARAVAKMIHPAQVSKPL